MDCPPPKEGHGYAGSGGVLFHPDAMASWVVTVQTCRGSPGEAPVHSRGADEVISVFERVTLPVSGGCWCWRSESESAGLVARSPLSRLWVTLFRMVADTDLFYVPSSFCPAGLQDRKRKGP